jgi:hypothetical protein
MTTTLLQQALAALERCTKHTDADYEAMDAIRAVLAAQPAPVPVPLKGHVYLVQWKQDGTQCIEAFADRSAAVAYANHIGLHAYVACVAVRTPEYVTHVFGIAASPEKHHE